MRRRAKKERLSPINTIGLIIAFVACAYALFVGTPSKLAESAVNSLAAASVSISAGVAPNPDNTAASELQQREGELNARQKALDIESSELSKNMFSGANALGLYSLLASTILFVLVGLNFYFDRKRSKQPSAFERALTVNLRV